MNISINDDQARVLIQSLWEQAERIKGSAKPVEEEKEQAMAEDYKETLALARSLEVQAGARLAPAAAAEEILSRCASTLDLSHRAWSATAKLGCRTIGDLCQMSERDLQNTRNFGEKSLQEIKDKLDQLGLSLALFGPWHETCRAWHEDRLEIVRKKIGGAR